MKTQLPSAEAVLPIPAVPAAEYRRGVGEPNEKGIPPNSKDIPPVPPLENNAFHIFLLGVVADVGILYRSLQRNHHVSQGQVDSRWRY